MVDPEVVGWFREYQEPITVAMLQYRQAEVLKAKENKDSATLRQLDLNKFLLSEMGPLSWVILHMILPHGYQAHKDGTVSIIDVPGSEVPCAFATDGQNILCLTPGFLAVDSSTSFPGQATNMLLAKNSSLFLFHNDNNLVVLNGQKSLAEADLGLVFNG